MEGLEYCNPACNPGPMLRVPWFLSSRSEKDTVLFEAVIKDNDVKGYCRFTMMGAWCQRGVGSCLKGDNYWS